MESKKKSIFYSAKYSHPADSPFPMAFPRSSRIRRHIGQIGQRSVGGRAPKRVELVGFEHLARLVGAEQRGRRATRAHLERVRSHQFEKDGHVQPAAATTHTDTRIDISNHSHSDASAESPFSRGKTSEPVRQVARGKCRIAMQTDREC